MKKRIEAKIKGSVQGVNFRYFCNLEANRLGLTGYARNMTDGRGVEVVAEGEEAELSKLVEWLRHGPPMARVENVAIEEKEFSGEFNDFQAL